MGWWIGPRRIADEPVVFEAVANGFRGWLKVAGLVTVTDRRFLFTPGRLDRLFGARDIAIDRARITGVALERPEDAIPVDRANALLRRPPRVGIECGDERVFVTVRHPSQLIAVLSERP